MPIILNGNSYDLYQGDTLNALETSDSIIWSQYGNDPKVQLPQEFSMEAPVPLLKGRGWIAKHYSSGTESDISSLYGSMIKGNYITSPTEYNYVETQNEPIDIDKIRISFSSYGSNTVPNSSYYTWIDFYNSKGSKIYSDRFDDYHDHKSGYLDYIVNLKDVTKIVMSGYRFATSASGSSTLSYITGRFVKQKIV